MTNESYSNNVILFVFLAILIRANTTSIDTGDYQPESVLRLSTNGIDFEQYELRSVPTILRTKDYSYQSLVVRLFANADCD